MDSVVISLLLFIIAWLVYLERRVARIEGMLKILINNRKGKEEGKKGK